MAAHPDPEALPATPFHDLDAFLDLPRVSGLAVSPDGTRVVTTITRLGDERAEFRGALWELHPGGAQPARRITHGATGESAPEFTVDGDLLFLASRRSTGDDKPPTKLWCLPKAGGEAYEICALPGGVDSARSRGGATVVASSMLPSATDIDSDRILRTARKDKKVSAVLHAGYPCDRGTTTSAPSRRTCSAPVPTAAPTSLQTLRMHCVTVFSTSAQTDPSWSRPGPCPVPARRCAASWCGST